MGQEGLVLGLVCTSLLSFEIEEPRSNECLFKGKREVGLSVLDMETIVILWTRQLVYKKASAYCFTMASFPRWCGSWLFIRSRIHFPHWIPLSLILPSVWRASSQRLLPLLLSSENQVHALLEWQGTVHLPFHPPSRPLTFLFIAFVQCCCFGGDRLFADKKSWKLCLQIAWVRAHLSSCAPPN